MDALDRLIQVTQTLEAPRRQGVRQARQVTFTAWAARQNMRARDYLQEGLSRDAGGLISATVSRWRVRQVAPNTDGRRRWQIGDRFTVDDEVWQVMGLQVKRNPGGFVDLYCEQNSQLSDPKKS